MKNWLTYIYLLMAGSLCLLATSCSQEDEGLEKEMAGEGKAIVQFSIALDKIGSSSRTTWGNEYEDSIGNDFENTINLSQFFVEMTFSDGVTIPVRRITKSANTKNVYEFVGEISVEAVKSLTDAKVIVYANIDKDDTEFQTNYREYAGRGVNRIPMWGVHTITSADVANLLLVPSTTLQLSKPIDLLRAMAKIELTLTETLVNEGYTIEGVTINKHNSRGNLIPTGGYGYTALYNREECINVSSPNFIEAPSGGLSFTEISANRYWIYVPEFLINKTDNLLSNDDLQIKIELYKGTEKFPEDRSSFSMFETSLVRNHWYKYTITSANMEEDVSFNLKYQVIDWQDIDNGTLNFGDQNGKW